MGFHASQALPPISSDLYKTLSSLTCLPHQGEGSAPTSPYLASASSCASEPWGFFSSIEAFLTKLLLCKNSHLGGVTNLCS